MAVKYAITAGSMNWSAHTWGQAVAGGVVSHPVTNAVLTPASSPGWTPDALIGLYVDIGGTAYAIADNDADTLTLGVVGPANGSYTWALFNEADPAAGDTAHLNGASVTQDVAAIPAGGGALTLLDSLNVAGTTTGGHLHAANGTLAATAITAGTYSEGIIYSTLTGANILAITCPTVTAGAGTAWAMTQQASGTISLNGNLVGSGGTGCIATSGLIAITGNVTGGTTGYGARASGGSISVTNGNVTGGSGEYYSYGIIKTSASGTVTLTNVNLVNSAVAMAYTGYPPVWNNSSKVNYIQFGTTKYAPELAATQVLGGVANGTVTGTLIGAKLVGAGGLVG